METPLAEGDLPSGKPLGWGGCHIRKLSVDYKDQLLETYLNKFFVLYLWHNLLERCYSS